MKKMFILAVSVIMMATANVNAQEVAPAKVDYNFNVNIKSLGRFLNLDEDQKSEMEYACGNFTAQVSHIQQVNEEERSERMQRVLARNLSFAHTVLDEAQYRKYLIILNNTMRNKHLDTLLESNNVAMAE